MAKRKASQLEPEADTSSLRRSTRRRSSAPETAPKDSPPPKLTQSKKQASKKADVKTPASSKAKVTKSTKSREPASKTEADGVDGAESSPQKSYWLMKAEPEPRFENGTNVSFSIDDLASRTEPEPWDGIRAYAARNNLRSMKKGELAFFYHSNCKEPGIVGTMEIMQEHSPDLSAHDPKAPYYDASSKPENPKWSVVHVEFRTKFAQSIGLKELREMGKPGQPLENMQMLKQSRLSVSRVTPSEWEHLKSVVKQRGGEVE